MTMNLVYKSQYVCDILAPIFTHQLLEWPQPQGYYERKEHGTFLFEFTVTFYVLTQKLQITFPLCYCRSAEGQILLRMNCVFNIPADFEICYFTGL